MEEDFCEAERKYREWETKMQREVRRRVGTFPVSAREATLPVILARCRLALSLSDWDATGYIGSRPVFPVASHPRESMRNHGLPSSETSVPALAYQLPDRSQLSEAVRIHALPPSDNESVPNLTKFPPVLDIKYLSPNLALLLGRARGPALSDVRSVILPEERPLYATACSRISSPAGGISSSASKSYPTGDPDVREVFPQRSIVHIGSGGSPGVGGPGRNGGSTSQLKMKMAQMGWVPPPVPDMIQPNLQGDLLVGSTASPQQGDERDTADTNVSMQRRFRHDSAVYCVRYGWNGNLIATGSIHSARIFDVETGLCAAVLANDDGGFDSGTGTQNEGAVYTVCFSPDSMRLITGAEDHLVKVWDLQRQSVEFSLGGHNGPVYTVDTSPNSRFIVSGSRDASAKLWNLKTGNLLSTLSGNFKPTDSVTSVSVSPCSQMVAVGSVGNVVRVWNVETSTLVRQFEGHHDSAWSVSFSPDRRLLLSGSADKTLKLWDLNGPSHQRPLLLSGHKNRVLSVRFSPDGKGIFSGSEDGSIQFWDARQSSMCLLRQGHKNAVYSIAHNPINQSLASASSDTEAKIWSYI